MRLLVLWAALFYSSQLFSQAQPLELKTYFFPYSTLFKAKVYKYINEDNPNDVVYQFTQSHIAHGDTILVLKRYNELFQELETMTQVISDTGVSLKHYSLYIAGEDITSNVLQSQVYQWQQAQDTPIKWKVSYQSPYGEEGFGKKRQVIQAPTPYRFHNVAYATMEFKDDFRHSVKGRKGLQTTNFYQYSQYAQGLGLVAYDRVLASGKKLRYRLDKIMNLKSWEALKKRPHAPLIPIKRT